MRNFQRTISNEGKLSGVGLHTGKIANVKFIKNTTSHYFYPNLYLFIFLADIIFSTIFLFLCSTK